MKATPCRRAPWALGVTTLALCLASPEARPDPAPKPPTMAEVLASTTAADWRPLPPDDTLYLELPAGRVVIELAPLLAPKNVGHIKARVREGYFDGLAVLRVQDNYVAQWGDPEEDPKLQRASKLQPATVAAEFSVPWSDAQSFTVLPDGDGYAPLVGFVQGFPAARDPVAGTAWLTHCYGALGVARGNDPDSDGTSLYVVIGHAPRHLDRNITVAGRVVSGIERLSSLPRGSGPLGFYEKPEERLRVNALRLARDVPEAERSRLEVLRTDSAAFTRLVETRRNRRDEWYKRPAGHVELCNVPIPVREIPPPR